jgi:phosphate-selective porin OprO/OprP
VRRNFSKLATLAFATTVLLAPKNANADSPIPITPTLLTQLDADAHPEAAEGQNGFSFARFRPGLWAQPTDWAFALATVEFAESESPAILDGFVTLVPTHGIRLTLGYSKNPLFLSARSELDGTMPMPELSMPVRALWPGRDLGIEGHFIPHGLPLEAWLRIGNGTNGPIGKAVTDSASFAYTARLDATAGRGKFDASPRDFFGLRVGVGAYFDDTEDHAGISGTTEGGYVFFQPPTVTGTRSTVEAHALVYAGPFRLLLEGGAAFENRATNASGSENGQRVSLDPVATRGESAELAWMITGQRRTLGAWPIHAKNKLFAFDKLGVEASARVERLDIGRDARDVKPSGSTGGSAALTCWLSDAMSVAVAGYIYGYDAAPIDEPSRTSSWLLQSRFTLYFNPPPPNRLQTKMDRLRRE